MTPEFSRPVRLDELGGTPRSLTLAADESERAALAQRFDLMEIGRLEADADLVRDGDIVIATGRLHAEVVQICVASGGPVPAAVAEAFTLRFVPTPAGGEAEEEMELDEGDLDEIFYEGGAIDLGEAVAQTLALALDPFPRAPDADAALREAGVLPEEDAGPFAALKALKDKL
ncbi:YceD family protein [Sphingomonas sp.]|uniref:YceD family protein n=1 Tax=Sphingomonas sp. TaxID=28214 RepID=UPI003B3B3573